MEKELDLRIQKTYKGLIESFMDLLEEKHFEDITVNELCDKAMLRRATFYKHFADKYEFFTFFVRWIKDDFNKKNKTNYKKFQQYYISGFHYLLDFLTGNQKLVNSILRSNVHPILLDIVFEEIAIAMQTMFEEDQKQNEKPVKPQVMAQLYTGALLYTVKWWLKQKNRMSQEELIEQISLWLPLKCEC